VFLSGDHDLYGQVSRDVHEILLEATPVIEPLALDEAFLDVTGALRSIGPAVEIAARIRRRIAEDLELACSVGGASNKFIAKLASKAAKPRIVDGRVRDGAGVVLVPPGEELAFLHPLPVQALWGVGPATLDRLTRLGVRTVRDLADIGLAPLVSAVGQAHGTHLHQLAWGIDDRPVESDRDAKSIGHEETFVHDRLSHDELYRDAVRLADGVASRLRAHGTGARTITLKLKFSDFTLITRSRTLPTPIATAPAILDAVDPLLRAVELPLGVRLLGISGSNFGEPAEQLSMDHLLAAGDEPAVAPPDWTTASGTIDAIRERFGAAAIGPASSVSVRGVRVVRTGAQQWGPDHDTPS